MGDAPHFLTARSSCVFVVLKSGPDFALLFSMNMQSLERGADQWKMSRILLSPCCSSPWRGHTPKGAITCRSIAMEFPYIVGLIVSVVLTVYLLYALVRPDRF
jgi:K+-transporting ATPase KdpF subunit